MGCFKGLFGCDCFMKIFVLFLIIVVYDKFFVCVIIVWIFVIVKWIGRIREESFVKSLKI